MLGADTNILLRLVLQDDLAQLAVIEEKLIRVVGANEQVHISPVVLAETIWTLVKVAKAPKQRVVQVIGDLGRTLPFRFFDDGIVASALTTFVASNAGFSDCLIRAMDAAAGCRSTMTFDVRALDIPGFAHPSAP